ncbi:zona pellucida-like domain-containing protein 1 [Hippoglossus hippoglossus]|uniref:zona pellucida-like domain-containing protein 1 n=1 Tax=Hippoglossus hippoglossus TaxID=8267 RepID=UPI00148C965E|nr:zona pellucida-like domain-containing protein 1 [Hippoglossus hippoglossus]
METYRSTLGTTTLVSLLSFLVLILRTEAQIPDVCVLSDTNRPPENSDITVVCGTEYMDLSIYICPVYQALYNQSLMVLNNEFNKPECFGTANMSAVPPVLQFKIPLNESAISACNSIFKVTTEVGTGEFSDFSNVQFINISGVINSIDPSAAMITYRPQIMYMFSCRYPMQYVLNNTEVAVSGVKLAMRGNNGSFISTLNLKLYSTEQYVEPLVIPAKGLSLKTKIYVAVTATNLTDRFNVLLDRCYATTNPYPAVDSFYDLFVGCTRDAQTKLSLNGVDQKAYFSFEAFRFVMHKNQTVSTFYLHCVTRLCEVSSCSSFLPNCDGANRRKREIQDVSDAATVSSPAILVGQLGSEEPRPASYASQSLQSDNYSSPVVAVIVCIVILTIFVAAMGAYVVLHNRRKPLIQ